MLVVSRWAAGEGKRLLLKRLLVLMLLLREAGGCAATPTAHAAASVELVPLHVSVLVSFDWWR